ncbi:MAG TPA: pyridoxal 5'-phosphate synthase [Gammaproteobacteria bacterium]
MKSGETSATAAPDDPVLVVRQWLEQAAESGRRRNPGAMALATVGADGRPSVRMVLVKAVCAGDGYAVFYTSYRSRKARELERFPRAAGVLYWEELGRQVRLEGSVVRSPEAESDAYFATRPFRSQLNAWVSAQSEPLGDPYELERRADALARDYPPPADGPADAPRAVPRPPFWGGYRLWCDRVELWTEGAGRFHTRLHYARALAPDGDTGFVGGPWRVERLQP